MREEKIYCDKCKIDIANGPGCHITMEHLIRQPSIYPQGYFDPLTKKIDLCENCAKELGLGWSWS